MKHRFSILLIGVICFGLYLRAPAQSDSWETYNQTGDNALTQRRYADAELTYREALKLSEKFKEKDPRLAVILSKLAESLNLQAKREEAEAFARRALLALEKAIKGSAPKDLKEDYYKTETSALILDKVAGIFVANQKYAEAEPIYKRLIALREEAVHPKETPKSNEDFLKVLSQVATHAQGKLAEAYDRLATLYLNQRRFEEAESLYVKALKATETEYGADNPPAALRLSRLATFYAMQGKYDKAGPLYSSAVTIFEKSNWLDKPEVARTFENYALLLRQTGREAEAGAILEKAKAIRSKLQQSTN